MIHVLDFRFRPKADIPRCPDTWYFTATTYKERPIEKFNCLINHSHYGIDGL